MAVPTEVVFAATGCVPSQNRSYPAATQGVFPRGSLDLVYYFMRRANEAMAAELESTDLAAVGVTDRLKLGVRARLRFLAPYLRSWPQVRAATMSRRKLAGVLALTWRYYRAGRCSACAVDRSPSATMLSPALLAGNGPGRAAAQPARHAEAAGGDGGRDLVARG
jgi:hypothetical protein